MLEKNRNCNRAIMYNKKVIADYKIHEISGRRKPPPALHKVNTYKIAQLILLVSLVEFSKLLNILNCFRAT